MLGRNVPEVRRIIYIHKRAIIIVSGAIILVIIPTVVAIYSVFPILLAVVLDGRFVVIPIRFRAIVPGAILSVLIILSIFLDTLLTTGAAATGGVTARRRDEQAHHRQPGYDQPEEPPAAHKDAVRVGCRHSRLTVTQWVSSETD